MTPTPTSSCANCGHPSTHPRICDPCEQRTRRNLTHIRDTSITAATTHAPPPTTTPTRTKPASRPPTGLDLDRIEPWLTATIELTPGDPDTRTPILNILTMWETDIRNQRPLTKLGPATSHEHTRADSLTATINFHHAHLEWTLQAAPHLDPATYIDHIQRSARALNRFLEPIDDPGFRVPCPTLTGTTECGAPLTITTHDLIDDTPTNCRNGHTWTARRLTYTATTSDTPIWIDLDTAAHHAGVHPRTITRWAANGHIHRQGNRYNWSDIQRHLNELTA